MALYHLIIKSESLGSSKQVDTQNLSGCYDAIFWAVGSCIISEPIGVHPGGVNHDLSFIYSVAVTTLGLGFCLDQVFHRETIIFHCNRDTESFCWESGPCSCSTPLRRLVLLWLELEPHLVLCFIYICNFRLQIYPFLLVFFAGKAFLARSIELCSVDNQ